MLSSCLYADKNYCTKQMIKLFSYEKLTCFLINTNTLTDLDSSYYGIHVCRKLANRSRVYSFRLFVHAGESFLKVPLLGAVSYLTVGVFPFCIAFAVVWAVFREGSFAWIGQDILVRNSTFSCIFLFKFFFFVSDKYGFPRRLAHLCSLKHQTTWKRMLFCQFCN